jgi:hypothetical protein
MYVTGLRNHTGLPSARAAAISACTPILIGIFVHVEGMDVLAGNVLLVDHLGQRGVLWIRRPQNNDVPLPFLQAPLDAAENVKEILQCVLGIVLDHRNLEVRVSVATYADWKRALGMSCGAIVTMLAEIRG